MKKLIQFKDVKIGEFFKWDDIILLKFFNEEWDEEQSMIIQGDKYHDIGDILFFDELEEIEKIVKIIKIM